MRCEGCPNPFQGVAASRGPRPAPLLFVGMCPGWHEVEEGIAFVGGSGKMLASACSQANYPWSATGAINVSNCEAAGAAGKKLTNEQVIACRERFQRELASSGAQVVVPLGGEALQAVCGFSGTRNTISSWRGYLVSPEECGPGRVGRTSLGRAQLPPTTRWIVPSYHPSFYMRDGLRAWKWFAEDIKRAVRALRGELNVVRPPDTDDQLPAGEPAVIAFDIETRGFSDEIERLGVACMYR